MSEEEGQKQTTRVVQGLGSWLYKVGRIEFVSLILLGGSW